jgi:Raf kinase inhibitor-like YbhB/YbcL family protein
MRLIRQLAPMVLLVTRCIAILAATGGTIAAAADPPKANGAFELRSPAFTDGGELPMDFTCDGSRASPPLEWANTPAGTRSFAVTMHHVPGPGDTHVYWVVYNIAADVKSLAKNSADVGVRGINTVNRRQEYTPPCSKGPGAKKYTLTVYALSAEPKLAVPAKQVTMEALLEAMKGNTLGTAVMNVTYTRKTGGQADGPAANGGRPEPRGGAGAGGGGAPGGERRGSQQGERRGPPPADRAIEGLTLSPEQKAKVEPILQQHRQKMREQREKLEAELLQELKKVLDAKQYEQVEAAIRQGGPPPPAPPPPSPRENSDEDDV